MKEKELRERAECSVCGNKLGTGGAISFMVVKIDRYMMDFKALRRLSGLTMQVGSPVLASVMGSDEDLANKIDSADLTLCEECSMDVLEMMMDAEEKKKEKKS